MSTRPRPIPERTAPSGSLLALLLLIAVPAGAQTAGAQTAGAQTPAARAAAQTAFEEHSIMLLPAEVEQIETALHPAAVAPAVESALQQVVAAPTPGAAAAPAVLPNIYLNGVFYLGPQSWTVWVNDRRIDSDNNDVEFRVVAVGPAAARLRWRAPGRAEPLTFTLQPHQTYRPETGEVREGDHRGRTAPAAAGNRHR